MNSDTGGALDKSKATSENSGDIFLSNEYTITIEEGRASVQIKRLKRRAMFLRMEAFFLVLAISFFFIMAGAIIFMSDKILKLEFLNPEQDRIRTIEFQINRISSIIEEVREDLKSANAGSREYQDIMANLHKLFEEQRRMILSVQPRSDFDSSLVIKEYVTRFSIVAIMLLAVGINVGFYRNVVRMYAFYTSRIDVLELVVGLRLPANVIIPALMATPDVEFGKTRYLPADTLRSAIERFRPSSPQ